MEVKKKYVSVYLELVVIEKVKEMAKEESRSFNNMVNEILKRGERYGKES
ncbi:MAG: hypothetical protein ACRC5T_06335 [Cetobacterium sp.]